MQLDPDMRGGAPVPSRADVYRYCAVLACGDETVALAATAAACHEPGDDAAAVFAAARAAVKAGLRERGADLPGPPEPAAARALYAARPALEEQHWSLLALVLPQYAQRPRHGVVDLAGVAAATGKKVDVTRKAVDRLVAPGGYLDAAMFAADAAAGETDCPELAGVVAEAKRLRPALRKAVAAHVAGCAACTAAREQRPPAVAVLSAVPLPAIPEELADPAPAAPPAPAEVAPPTESALIIGDADDVDDTGDPGDIDDIDDIDDADVTVELVPATVYHPLPAIATGRLPLLRRPPVLLAVVVVLLAVAATAGILGVRSASTGRLAGAAAAPSVAVTTGAAPPLVLPAPGVGVSGSAGGGRTPAASGHAKASASPSPPASASPDAVEPLVAAGDRLREVLPLLVQAPGCPGQTFGGSCYSVQPFTLPLAVAVPAGFDEARLADALMWTVRAQTVLGPVEFRGRGNHARVTVTDGGQATPPTVWTMQAALTVGGETHLSNEVTLRVYATT